jgi:hypothetical protein
VKKQQHENTDQQGKRNVHKTQPQHRPATTAGHTEGTTPKSGEDTMALKGGEEHVISEMIRTKSS